MIASHGRVVIVGASIAGLTAAEELRSNGFDGQIELLDEQIEQPYARPPLSKAFLSGIEGAAEITLPGFDHLGVTHRSGVTVIGLDRDRRRVVLSGEEVPYDGLVITTGARAATLRDFGGNPEDLPETVLRTMADAEFLRDRFESGGRLVIIGGGILGMEIASTATDAGVSVTVLGRTPAMTSSLGTFIGSLVTTRASEAGVDYRIIRGDARLEAASGGVGVRTPDEHFEADLIVSAVGCRPNVEWLRGSGLRISPGLVVDDYCRVASDIVAAGDVVSVEGQPRVPHWGTALDQARTAAAALIRGDEAERYTPRPYFWTHQFGLSFKVAGRIPITSRPTLLDGSEDELAALWQWHDQDDRPIAAAALNRRIPIARLHAHAGQQ